MLPFANRSGDTADAYLASTITDEVTGVMTRTHGVRVLSTGGARLAEYQLTGSVRRRADALSVTVRLEHRATSRIAWSARFDRPARELAAVSDTIVAGALRTMGVRGPAFRPRRLSADPDVFDLYARGLYQVLRRNEPALARAVTLFRQAIERDSTSALGWVGLARALERARRWGFAVPGVPRDSVLVVERLAAERATELDPDSPEVWLMRGRVAEDVDQYTRTPSIGAYRRAIALDSLNGEAWRSLGLSLIESGDTGGARVAFARAAELGPASGEILGFLALYHFWMRDFAAAARWGDSAAATDPTHTLAHNAAGRAAYELGRLEQAEGHFEASRRLSTGPQIEGLVGLAMVAARRGDTARARSLLVQAEARTDTAHLFVHAPEVLAQGFAILGDQELALHWLERYQPRRDVHYQMHLRFEPGLDRLRAHPRFRALLIEPR